MSDKMYDTLKAIGLVAVPIIVFLTALINIWHIPYGDEIVASLAALDVLIGSIVAVAKSQYDRKQAKIEDDTYY